jgi:lipopolysaccharide transport system ATP-binding protein
MTPAPVVVEVRDIAKRFRRAPGSGVRTLHGIGSFRKSAGGTVALSDVSFDVHRGECFALIGRNGSGKSTMLRIVAALTRQTSGTVVRRGNVGGILSLGAGLDPDLTGAENAITSAILAGVPRAEAPSLVRPIAEWAELDDAMLDPVRTFSDGMRLRLAFSAAVHAPTEIFVLDEALAAGDIRFQEKCLRKLEELKQTGTTVIVVSHVMAQVDRLCDRAIWLDKGHAVLLGEAREVTTAYNNRDLPVVQPQELVARGSARIGDGSVVQIKEVRVRPSDVESGRAVRIGIEFDAKESVRNVHVMVGVHAEGELVRMIDVRTDIPSLAVGVSRVEAYIAQLDLSAGDYWLDVGIFSDDYDTCFDARWQACPIKVNGAASPGPYLPKIDWKTTRPNS